MNTSTPLRRQMLALSIGLLGCTTAAQAAVITFDDLLSGQTAYGFDGDGDGINDVIFSTSDPAGFNVIGPGPNQTYIHEPGLEGTSLLNPDLRVDFLRGAVDSLRFGFALDSSTVAPGFFASIRLFDAGGNLLGEASQVGDYTVTAPPDGLSSFPEGEVSLLFAGTAAYATFDFATEFGRFIIDDFAGTYGSTERIPEPSTAWLLGAAGLALAGSARRRRR